MIMCLHICRRAHAICPPLQESTQMSTSAGVALHRQQHNRTQHNTSHHTTTQHNTTQHTTQHTNTQHLTASCFVIGEHKSLETKASHQGGTHTGDSPMLFCFMQAMLCDLALLAPYSIQNKTSRQGGAHNGGSPMHFLLHANNVL
jgi:hypothetical protein